MNAFTTWGPTDPSPSQSSSSVSSFAPWTGSCAPPRAGASPALSFEAIDFAVLLEAVTLVAPFLALASVFTALASPAFLAAGLLALLSPPPPRDFARIDENAAAAVAAKELAPTPLVGFTTAVAVYEAGRTAASGSVAADEEEADEESNDNGFIDDEEEDRDDTGGDFLACAIVRKRRSRRPSLFVWRHNTGID